MQRFDHDRFDFQPYGFTCELWTAAPMRRPDRHNEIELNLLKSGTLTYLFGGKRVSTPSGGLCAFWAAAPHQIIDSSGDPEYYVVTLPLAWFLQCRLPKKFVDRLLHGEFLSESTVDRLSLDLQLFQTWIGDLAGIEGQPKSAIQLEIQARLERFADSIPEGDPDEIFPGSAVFPGGGGLGKAERLAAYIAQHYQETIPIEKIAGEVDLHPNYAMGLFKKTFNLTINEYLTQLRLSHAQRLLATTDDKVIDIALDAGYQTLSRFYVAFDKSCGCSPGNYRREHRMRL
ncbi:MAG: helix-turn-helix domain-containing protein [Verrucomicrobiaceae bacterium]